MHIRPQCHDAHRATDRQSPHEEGCRCARRRRFLEGQGSDRHRLSEMLSPTRQLLSDADKICGRTNDDVLPVPEVRPSMEGKLKVPLIFLLFVVIMSVCVSLSVASQLDNDDQSSNSSQPFFFVIFLCVWKRPLLTQFVVDHFVHLARHAARDDIRIDIFLIGSDEAETRSLALSARAEVTSLPSSKYFTNISYVIHPNHPVGQKHQLGLESLRALYAHNGNDFKVPDAVAIFGSDDLVTAPFFSHARNALTSGAHIFGLRDVWFYQLQSRHLIYTAGYTSSKTPLSNTVGCGRVFSWAVLDAIRWRVWDKRRDHGLDQSAVRHVMRRFAFAADISEDVLGRPLGILAVDVKTDSFAKHGTNVWRFDSVLKAASDGNGRLQKYTNESADESFKRTFGSAFLNRLNVLRSRMIRAEED